MRFINEDDQAYLLTGSSDGVIKVYKNYEDDSRAALVTAWRALTDLINSNVNAGLVFEWQQGQGKALVAGDVKVIRVWNAATELCMAVCPLKDWGSTTAHLLTDPYRPSPHDLGRASHLSRRIKSQVMSSWQGSETAP